LPAAPPDLAGEGRRRPGRPWAAGRPLAAVQREWEREKGREREFEREKLIALGRERELKW